MCSHFEKLLIVIPLARCRRRQRRRILKPAPSGSKLYFLIARGPHVFSVCGQLLHDYKLYFLKSSLQESSGKMCSGHVNFLPNRNYSRFEVLAWPRFYQFISLNIIDVVSQKIISIWSEYFIPNMKQWIDTTEKQRSKRFVSRISQFGKNVFTILFSET